MYITDLFAKGLGGGCSVGGKSLPIDSISLMAGAAQSSTWIIPVALSILGIGMFVASRSENLSLK